MPKSKARVICNPTSGGGLYDPDEIRDELDAMELDWIQTEGPEDAIEAAAEWREGLILVAGGDGTINGVVNGLGRAGFPEGVTLGILPAGTGNDLAATLCIPEDPELAEDVIRQNRVRTLDVARVRSEGVGERFFINVATGGLGAEISSVNDEELKKRWGKLSYLRASLEVARNFDVRDLSLYLDGEERRVKAVNIAVGNCRYTGGGWPATPKANPEDGLLDVVVIETLGAGELFDLAPAVLAESVTWTRRACSSCGRRRFGSRPSPPGWGLPPTAKALATSLPRSPYVPKPLKVIVGPEYVPEPAG